jgi:cobalamin biosynthesis Mg chelatase CobN
MLEGTLFVVPFKSYYRGAGQPKLYAVTTGMDEAVIMGGEENGHELLPVDSFWEEYRNNNYRYGLHVVGSHLDEKEQEELDMQEVQRVLRSRMK